MKPKKKLLYGLYFLITLGIAAGLAVVILAVLGKMLNL